MTVYQLGDDRPEIAPEAYVAASAQVIGKVRLAAGASIWPGAVLRGDLAPISVGAGSNVQDNAVLHTEAGVPCTIGADATVGHAAILHSCTVGDGALVGMGAIVLNRARIGRDAVVGAGALVAEGKTVEERTLVVGCPARFVRRLTDEEVARNRANTARYVDMARVHAQTLVPLEQQDGAGNPPRRPNAVR